LLDSATSIAPGGDCLTDVAVLRGRPRLFGSVASNPTVARCVDARAGDVDAVVVLVGVSGHRPGGGGV
jgi:hypothetical protein